MFTLCSIRAHSLVWSNVIKFSFNSFATHQIPLACRRHHRSSPNYAMIEHHSCKTHCIKPNDKCNSDDNICCVIQCVETYRYWATASGHQTGWWIQRRLVLSVLFFLFWRILGRILFCFIFYKFFIYFWFVCFLGIAFACLYYAYVRQKMIDRIPPVERTLHFVTPLALSHWEGAWSSRQCLSKTSRKIYFFSRGKKSTRKQRMEGKEIK